MLTSLIFFHLPLTFPTINSNWWLTHLRSFWKKIILVIVMILKLLNRLRWWEPSPEEDTRVRAGATWAEWDSTGHQRVAGVEQDNLVLLKLEGRLKGGERIDHLVPAVEHIAVIQALPVSCGKKNTETVWRERISSNQAAGPWRVFGFSTCGDGHARGYGAALAARYSGRHGEDGDVDVPVVLLAHHQVHQQGAGTPSAERTGGDAQTHALFRSLAASLNAFFAPFLTWSQIWRFWSGHWATRTRSGKGRCRFPPLQTDARDGPEVQKEREL